MKRKENGRVAQLHDQVSPEVIMNTTLVLRIQHVVNSMGIQHIQPRCQNEEL